MVGNDFANWYYKEVKGSRTEKMRIVREDPILALRIFTVFGDRGVGICFYQVHRNNPEYSEADRPVGQSLRFCAVAPGPESK